MSRGVFDTMLSCHDEVELVTVVDSCFCPPIVLRRNEDHAHLNLKPGRYPLAALCKVAYYAAALALSQMLEGFREYALVADIDVSGSPGFIGELVVPSVRSPPSWRRTYFFLRRDPCQNHAILLGDPCMFP